LCPIRLGLKAHRRPPVQRNGLGVALQSNAEGGGGRALLRNATSGPCPSLHPMHPLHPYGMHGMQGMHGTGLGQRLGGFRPCIALLRLGLHRFAPLGVASLRDATPQLLRCETIRPVLASHASLASHRDAWDARDAWNGLGVALQGNAEGGGAVHCEAMQPQAPARPTERAWGRPRSAKRPWARAPARPRIPCIPCIP
jgi:hypothetical protein